MGIYYSCCDEASPGCITVMDWCLGLSSVLQLDLDFEAYHEALVLLTPDGHINWHQFLGQYQVQGDAQGKHGDWVTEMKETIRSKLMQRDLSVPALFRLLDTDGDGFLSADELVGSLQGLGLDLGASVLSSLLPEPGDNGMVDVMTFIGSLQPTYSGRPLDPEVEEVIKAIEATMGRCPKVPDVPEGRGLPLVKESCPQLPPGRR